MANSLSKTGADKLIQREGERLVAYPDPGTGGEPWTIGVGHTGTVEGVKVHKGMSITKDMSRELFQHDVQWAVDAVNSTVKVPLTQNQFDALVSFTFNIGAAGFKRSSVLVNLNNKHYNNAAEAMMQWVKPAILKGRRSDERRQFLTPYPNSSVSAASPASQEAPKPEVTKKEDSTMEGILGSLASMVFGAATKVQTVTAVASVAPHIIGGAFKSVDEAEKGVVALVELANDIRGGRWGEVADDVKEILSNFRKIMINFGIDHDELNKSALKVADVDSVATLSKNKG